MKFFCKCFVLIIFSCNSENNSECINIKELRNLFYRSINNLVEIKNNLEKTNVFNAYTPKFCSSTKIPTQYYYTNDFLKENFFDPSSPTKILYESNESISDFLKNLIDNLGKLSSKYKDLSHIQDNLKKVQSDITKLYTEQWEYIKNNYFEHFYKHLKRYIVEYFPSNSKNDDFTKFKPKKTKDDLENNNNNYSNVKDNLSDNLKNVTESMIKSYPDKKYARLFKKFSDKFTNSILEKTFSPKYYSDSDFKLDGKNSIKKTINDLLITCYPSSDFKLDGYESIKKLINCALIKIDTESKNKFLISKFFCVAINNYDVNENTLLLYLDCLINDIINSTQKHEKNKLLELYKTNPEKTILGKSFQLKESDEKALLNLLENENHIMNEVINDDMIKIFLIIAFAGDIEFFQKAINILETYVKGIDLLINTTKEQFELLMNIEGIDPLNDDDDNNNKIESNLMQDSKKNAEQKMIGAQQHITKILTKDKEISKKIIMEMIEHERCSRELIMKEHEIDLNKLKQITNQKTVNPKQKTFDLNERSLLDPSIIQDMKKGQSIISNTLSSNPWISNDFKQKVPYSASYCNSSSSNKKSLLFIAGIIITCYTMFQIHYNNEQKSIRQDNNFKFLVWNNLVFKFDQIFLPH